MPVEFRKASRDYGDWFSYEKSPRVQNFHLDHGKVIKTLTMLTPWP